MLRFVRLRLLLVLSQVFGLMESRGEGVQRLGALGAMTTFRASCGGLRAAEIRNFVIVLTVELGGLLTPL